MLTTRDPSPLILLAVLSLPALFIAGCGPGAKGPGEDPRATHVVPIEVALATEAPLIVTKTYSGTLEGEEQANIVAKLSERITGVKSHVGESVRAGQVIILLDKSGAQSQYYQAEANFKNARKTLDRMSSLFKEGAVSQQTLDGSQMAFDIARANFDAARGSVELTSPIAGVVTAVNVSMGDLATPGAVLATVAKIERLKVTFNINETDVTYLSLGQKVKVWLESKPDTQADGSIIQLSKSADVRSRTFEIKAMFANSRDRWFKPGLYCKVAIGIAPQSRSVLVPNVALLGDGVTNRVFLIRNGRAYQRTVKAGMTDGQRTAILQGLAAGDTVAAVGVTNLQDSSTVNVVQR